MKPAEESPGGLRLIATDLDGTLLNRDHALSPRNAAALTRAQAAGLVVVLVTGRPVRMVLPLARQLELRGHVICSNGAATHRLPAGEQEDCVGLSAAELRAVIPTLRAELPGAHFALEYGDVVIRERGAGTQPADVADILDGLQDRPVLKLIVRAPLQDVHALNAHINARFHGRLEASTSGANFSEVAAHGVNKGYALARLCRLLDVPACSCVVFGDAHNDLSMFAFAGRSVAMANAPEDVQARATDTTLSNDDDGVAAYLERLLERHS